MRVDPLLEDDRVFEPGRQITLVRGGVKESFEIEFSRKQHGRLILKLRGIDSISEVQNRVGAEVSVSEEQIPPALQGTFYTFHLKGCVVITADGDLVGTVSDVLDSGGAPILKVDGKNGEILIPFAEVYLRNIDLGQRRIEVELPEGLRDLNT
jgi:16S rRNA processing protein RimM